MLYNVKAIQNDFSRRKELSGDVVVGAKHVHSNDFNAVSDLSRITKEMIANGCLRSSVEDCYDLERVKILRNEVHLALLEAVFIPRHVSWKVVEVRFKLEFFQFTNNCGCGDS